MGSLIDIITREAEEGNTRKRAVKPKTSFWASETETMAFDIYHKWIGTPPTNPMEGETVQMLSMRKMSEVAAVSMMRKANILIKRYSNDERIYFEWEPNKVPISGYPDAGVQIDNGTAIVEIKTYYGQHNHIEISAGRVKLSYLKQLAIYLYALKLDHGILLMINQGTGEMFEFDLYRKGEYHFLCPDNEIEFDLKETFQRWEKIYTENILPKVEPEIEYLYKEPIESIKWDEISGSQIAKARNNQYVIGHWSVKYSDYKDMIIERQGTVSGYTEEELTRIKELTSGYSTKRSGLVRFDPKKDDPKIPRKIVFRVP